MNNIVKLIIIGALIIAVPVTVKLVQQQQILKSKAAGNGIPVTDNPPNAKRPCDNAYTWKALQPGANGAPALDATRFGMGNDGQGNGCSQHSNCPKNTSDPQNVDENTSYWCYEFGVGNRCIQLQHIDGQTCSGGGGGGGGGGTCTIGGQSPDMGPTCSVCLSSKTAPTNVPGVIANIKNMNPNDFSACSNQKILNNWCNAFGAEAARQCNELKTGVCAISCGGSLPNPTPGSADPKGWLDAGATCNAIKGWTCDGDNYATSLQVDFYADGPVGQGVSLGNATANLTREAAVGTQCGGNSNHGFSFVVPANSLRDGKPHNIYAYGINAGSSGANQLLQGSPQSVTCTSDTPTPPSPPKPPPALPPSNRLPGDADDNRCVNVDDYTIWKQEAGVGGTKKCANWTTENPSTVDTEDYGIWYRAWKVLTNRQGCITPPAGSRCIDK